MVGLDSLLGGGGLQQSATSGATGGTVGGAGSNSVTYNAGFSLSNPMHLAALGLGLVAVLWMLKKRK